MTKTNYFDKKQRFVFPLLQKKLSALALFLFLTGCQLDSSPPLPSELITPDKAKPPLSEKINVDNLWVRIRSGLALDLDQHNHRIQEELNWYKSNKSYLSLITKRSTPYLYFIVKEAEIRDVPLELALMPIVESSFDPFAYSHAGASGLWQFMPETAEYFGLTQNWWYDGRRDIVHSTKAALDYMASLYKMFDDWELALAAFNSGPGRVRQAVKKNKKLGKSTKFWALDLPNETTAYVPKLIALGKIISNPSLYGIELDSIPNEPYFDKVHLGSQLDLAKAAKLSDVELEELYWLNPGLNRWSTPPDGPHHLVVPITQAEYFRTQLAKLPKKDRLQWIRYSVKKNDTIGSIAKRYRTSSDIIIDVNKLSSTTIIIGQELMIPIAAESADSYSLSVNQRLATKQNRSISGHYKVEHIVSSGESFWTIAKKYSVGITDLARWNHMSSRDTLKINQKLIVWKKYREQGDVTRKVYYKVRSGDSLAKIASKFNVNIDQIRNWNTGMTGKYIHPGQQVTLFVNVTNNF